MRCRKKPIVVDSWQWNNDKKYYDDDEALENVLHDAPRWITDAVDLDIIIFYFDRNLLKVKTLEGDHHGRANDYIMRGVQGELYICREDIYKATYDELGDEDYDNL